MTRIERIERPGFEDVLVWRDEITPLTAIVVIHSTALGPAVGGTRWQPYASFDDALSDALRLSEAMTKKAAAAGLAFGGGKAVVIGDQNAKSIDQLRSYARFLNQLEGRFVTTTDVGTTTRELDQLRAWARHVAGLSAMLGGAGDTSGLTATTVLGGMRATFEALDGEGAAGGAAGGEFAGRRIVVIGVGKVGSKVARRLAVAGAQLTIADIRADAAAELAAELGAIAAPLEEAWTLPCDLLSPNALGGVFSAETIPTLRCRAICGAANNQLAREPQDAELLAARGILFAPDYVVNSGGLISVAGELSGWSPARSEQHAEGVYEVTSRLFRDAAARGHHADARSGAAGRAGPGQRTRARLRRRSGGLADSVTHRRSALVARDSVGQLTLARSQSA